MMMPNCKTRPSQFKAGQSVVLTNSVFGLPEGTIVTVVNGEKLKDQKIEVLSENGKTYKVRSKYLAK